MSEVSPLHTLVHARLREVFGEPSGGLGRNDHWSLTSSTSDIAINVLIEGTDINPAVWVFDPGDPDHAVIHAPIEREDQLESIIQKIQDRLKRASERPN